MDTYEVRLAQFEGPLDLLLHLVNKAQIDLKDIFISEITQQYLDLMEQLPQVDLDRAGEFIRMASVLLYIKSRYLLPAPPPPAIEDDGVDPEAELMDQLRLYKMYKDAAEKLRLREGFGDTIFSKPPEDLAAGAGPPEIRGDAAMLQGAFLRILRSKRRKRVSHPPEVHIELETWTVPMQKEKLLAVLASRHTASFSELFEPDAPAEEVVVTFSAMLELWSAGSIRVSQGAPFTRIRLDCVPQDADRRAEA